MPAGEPVAPPEPVADAIAEPDAPLGVADGPGVLPDADPTVAAFDDDPGLPPEPDVVPDPEPDPLP